jgi:ElaB/YqjD/DUF883 family membrane-anchored ribosome-binding protein
MPRRAKSSSSDVAAVEELMQDLETRLRRLNSRAQESESPGEISDFVAQTLARIAGQVRNTADSATDTLADEATRASTDFIRRIWDEMQRHPIATLAVAAGAGYLLGLIGKQDR